MGLVYIKGILIRGNRLVDDRKELVKIRGRQTGDSTINCVYFDAATAQVVHHYSGSTAEELAVHTAEWRLLMGKLPADGNAVVVCPISEAGHWTVLFLHRQAGAWHASYHESLKAPGSASCRVKAAVLLSVICALLMPDQPALAMPDTLHHREQGDAWSCGYHVVARMDEAYAQAFGLDISH